MGGRPPGTADERQRAIRDAALTLFAERGYLGTGMRDLAEHVGIRAPSLYNHLGAKQDLLREVVDEAMAELLAAHRAALNSSPDVVEQLRRAMEAHVRYHAVHPREVAIVNGELRHLEEPAHTRVSQLRNGYASSWTELITRGVREGRFVTPSPALAALALLGIGVAIPLWFTEEGPFSESELAYHYGDMALSLLNVVPAAVRAGGQRPDEPAAMLPPSTR